MWPCPCSHPVWCPLGQCFHHFPDSVHCWQLSRTCWPVHVAPIAVATPVPSHIIIIIVHEWVATKKDFKTANRVTSQFRIGAIIELLFIAVVQDEIDRAARWTGQDRPVSEDAVAEGSFCVIVGTKPSVANKKEKLIEHHRKLFQRFFHSSCPRRMSMW